MESPGAVLVQKIRIYSILVTTEWMASHEGSMLSYLNLTSKTPRIVMGKDFMVLRALDDYKVMSILKPPLLYSTNFAKILTWPHVTLEQNHCHS